jgi:hypothetical protein
MPVVEYVLFDMDGLLLYVAVFSSQKSVIDALVIIGIPKESTQRSSVRSIHIKTFKITDLTYSRQDTGALRKGDDLGDKVPAYGQAYASATFI